FPTSLEAARSRGVVDTQVLTAAQLALEEEEIATLVDLALPALRQDPRRAEVLRQLSADPAQRRLGARGARGRPRRGPGAGRAGPGGAARAGAAPRTALPARRSGSRRGARRDGPSPAAGRGPGASPHRA